MSAEIPEARTLNTAAWIGVALTFIAMLGGLVLFAIYGETRPLHERIGSLERRVDKLERVEDRVRNAEIRLGPGGEKP